MVGSRGCSWHQAPAAQKLDADQESVLKLLHRWRKEAEQAGHPIKRVVVAYEAGRDGFWLARWLEAYVIHPTSIAVSREHRRAKTDRLWAVCVMDPAGKRLKIPIWMLLPECAEITISQRPHLGKQA